MYHTVQICLIEKSIFASVASKQLKQVYFNAWAWKTEHNMFQKTKLDFKRISTYRLQNLCPQKTSSVCQWDFPCFRKNRSSKKNLHQTIYFMVKGGIMACLMRRFFLFFSLTATSVIQISHWMKKCMLLYNICYKAHQKQLKYDKEATVYIYSL